MNLVAAERIKLFSTRSPWWCGGMTIVLVVGATLLVAASAPSGYGAIPPSLLATIVLFGLVVAMVMATLSVTTEYRFATIRTTFQAVPHRPVALLAKTAVTAITAGVVGLVAGFGAWAVQWAVRPSAAPALAGDAAWRIVAGVGLVFAVAAVISVAVGILLRHTAGAVALLLVWTLMGERIITAIPGLGSTVHGWLPFANAENFLSGTGGDGPGMPFGPWGSLAYFAVVAAALLGAALAVANRRDA